MIQTETWFPNNNSLLDELTIKFGPRERLARFFLELKSELEKRDIRLERVSFFELLEINRANRAHWLPLTPTFDVTYNPDLTARDAYAFVGRDARGVAVATHASCLFQWDRTSFHDECETLRLFYKNPREQALSGETCAVIAPNAKRMRGNVVYSGAAWYHPAVRGSGLTGLLSRFNRAYAMSQWPVDVFTGLISQKNVARAFNQRAGHANTEFGVESRGSTHGDVDYSLVWSTPDAVIGDIDTLTWASNGVMPVNQRYA